MESITSPSETSLIRQTALDLLEQAYQTDASQTLSRERANRLEALIARRLAGTTQNFNQIRAGPLLDRYIDLVTQIGLHLSEATWTGFCSCRLNGLLREEEPPLDLPGWSSEQFFPELHLNRTLSEEERKSCLERVEREREALRRAFKSALASGGFGPRFFEPDDGLYSDYYNQVCLEDGVPPTRRPPGEQIFIELGPQGYQVFTISTRQLIDSSLIGTNPMTGFPYSCETLQRIEGRFPTELKLLRGKDWARFEKETRK